MRERESLRVEVKSCTSTLSVRKPSERTLATTLKKNYSRLRMNESARESPRAKRELLSTLALFAWRGLNAYFFFQHNIIFSLKETYKKKRA